MFYCLKKYCINSVNAQLDDRLCFYFQGRNDGDLTKTSEFPVDNAVSCLLALYFYIFMTCLTDN